MTFYAPQGEGANLKPHLLIAKIDNFASGGVRWTVQCPYEGPRECGLLEECHGSPKDVEKWGCELLPEVPNTTPLPNGKGGYEYQADDQEAWEAWEEARDHWRNVVHGGYAGHRTEECWFVHMATRSDYFEPECFLAEIPVGTPIHGPLKVLVGYEGSGEETEPIFKLWEEHGDADSQTA